MMDFYNQKHVRARKSHKCEFCGKEIIPGETYSYESGKFDGDFFVRKLCEPCFTMLAEFIDYTGEDEFQWDWIQEWLYDEYCKDDCKYNCEYGFSKVQCCPIVREKFKRLLEGGGFMKYIASWSGGKDSTASIILAHEHNEPLDLIIFSEVMFDENISGELPEHIEFIKNKAIPVFESWGYETKILHSDRTYADCFFRKTCKGKFAGTGKRAGFPMMGKCVINRDCKMRQIRQFWKEIEDDFTQYIGIAIDEPVRMERVAKAGNQISLLERYAYTEQMAFDLCRKYDLLSPIYDFASRGGCWFCPNMRYAQLKHLRTHHPDLWNKLLELENEPDLVGNIWNTLTKTRIHDWEERFYWEEQQMSIFDYLEDGGERIDR